MAGRNLRAVLAGLALVVVPALPSSAAAATTGDVIVKFAPGSSVAAHEAGLEAVGGDVQGKLRTGAELLDVEGSASAAVTALERRAAVAWAEPVKPTTALATFNDPLMWTQWGLRNTAQYQGGIAGDDIHAESAWDIARGDGVLLGVVDTGVKFDHPDLGGFYWNNGEVAGNGKDDDHDGFVDDMRGWDFVNRDPTPTDDHGHGTYTTSVAAARSNNGIGMAGVAPGAAIIEAKSQGPDGSGNTFVLAQALDYLGAKGARVVNVSIGAGYTQAVTDAIAAHPDTLYVVAAGNYNRDNDIAPVYPCALPNANVLCAGASGHEDARASFSNWGKTTVDLMAPGISITAASLSNGYAAVSGTSFSSPLTAGAAALLFSHRPQATPAMVKRAILAGADPVPAFADITVTGGRLNARAALDALTADMAGAPVASAAPTISGTARMERTLTAADGTWSGSSTTYARQWMRCSATGGACMDIAGARDATYVATKNEVGNTLRVRVVATDGETSAQSISARTAVVGADPPANTVAPATSGTYVYGSTLTGSAGTWSGAPTFSYQWLTCTSTGASCTAIAGATSLTLKLDASHYGHALRLRVTATGPGGTVTKDSAATPSIAGAAPVATVGPAISGTARLGSTLTVTNGSWSGLPTPTITRQWLRCDAAGTNCTAIAGATGSTYVLGGADLGAKLRVGASAVNSYGTRTANSTATPVVVALAPSTTVAPTVSGTARQTLVLTGSEGTWQGNPTPTRTRSWLRCDASGNACAVIAGQAATTYTLTATDLGKTIRFRVVGANVGGSVDARSAPTAVVAVPPVAAANTVAPAITGTAQATRTLTATNGTWTGTPAPTLAGQWMRCNASGDACAAIGGASATTYVVAASDAGSTLRYRVTATNAAGLRTVLSAATAVVIPMPPVKVTAPTITGSAVAGMTLTIANGTWTNSPTSYRYQWHRCDTAGANCTGLPGETAATHVLAIADLNHTLRAWVTAVNAVGSSATTTTAQSAIVH